MDNCHLATEDTQGTLTIFLPKEFEDKDGRMNPFIDDLLELINNQPDIFMKPANNAYVLVGGFVGLLSWADGRIRIHSVLRFNPSVRPLFIALFAQLAAGYLALDIWDYKTRFAHQNEYHVFLNRGVESMLSLLRRLSEAYTIPVLADVIPATYSDRLELVEKALREADVWIHRQRKTTTVDYGESIHHLEVAHDGLHRIVEEVGKVVLTEVWTEAA